MMIDNSRQIPAYRCESQLSNWGAPGAWQGPTGFGGKFSLCGSRIVLRLEVETCWAETSVWTIYRDRGSGDSGTKRGTNERRPA